MYFILEIAIPCPLRQTFDYLGSETDLPWQLGSRVVVPFGSREVIGIICGIKQQDSAPEKLKTISRCLDKTPLLPNEIFKLILWVSRYYHHPIGECFQAALPKRLRQNCPATLAMETIWSKVSDSLNLKGEKQKQLLQTIAAQPSGISQQKLKQQFGQISKPLQALESLGLITQQQQPELFFKNDAVTEQKQLNAEQQQVFEFIQQHLDRFQPFLLQGVTGSGKTELYLQLCQAQIERGKQVLILIPEIGLTGQFISRFQQGLNAKLALSHSAISDKQRQQTWLLSREGHVDVVIGTRSAIFIPLKNPGLIIIDEEHDASFKQQDGLRYHARNIALLRARNLNIPIILGSATPSLESLYQVRQQRFKLVELKKRAGNAALPSVELVSCDALKAADQGLNPKLIAEIGVHLGQQQQVLLFINRRGFAPVLMCHNCDWQATCRSCDAKMVVHQQRNVLCCHHCGLIQKLPTECPECSASPLSSYGVGTEKIEQTLMTLFPETPVIRIDRDTTQRVNAFAEMVDTIQQGQPAILVGTQMLAKGHDFHGVTLVGVIDADQGLFSADFRATELLAQSITQVTGRSGRGEKAGKVLIQTQQIQHPFWQPLLHQGYSVVAEQLLEERIQLGLPPKGFWAVWRAEHLTQGLAMALLTDLVEKMPNATQVQIMGPVPAVMEKRAGRYRAQLLLSSAHRNALHQFIAQSLPLMQQCKLARKVRWSIDIDPTELL